MVTVYGTIADSVDKLDYEVNLPVDSIDDKDMPIPESTKLIIDAINAKYKSNFSLKSHLNPLKIKK